MHGTNGVGCSCWQSLLKLEAKTLEEIGIEEREQAHSLGHEYGYLMIPNWSLFLASQARDARIASERRSDPKA